MPTLPLERISNRSLKPASVFFLKKHLATEAFTPTLQDPNENDLWLQSSRWTGVGECEAWKLRSTFDLLHRRLHLTDHVQQKGTCVAALVTLSPAAVSYWQLSGGYSSGKSWNASIAERAVSNPGAIFKCHSYARIIANCKKTTEQLGSCPARQWEGRASQCTCSGRTAWQKTWDVSQAFANTAQSTPPRGSAVRSKPNRTDGEKRP